jgi:hypothetical protein
VTAVEWQSVAAVGQLVVLLVAVLYARGQVREARRLREDQARPFVVVDFAISVPPTIRLAISNIGKTMARDVRVSFTPTLRSSLDKSGERVADLRMLNEPIPTMPPGKVYSTMFDVFIHDDLPSRYTVIVRYRDDRDPELPPDTYSLDLSLYEDLVPDWQKTTKDLHEELHRIRLTLERWSAGMGAELLVSTVEDRRRRREELLAARNEQAGQAATDGVAASNGRTRLTGRLLEVVGRLLRHD